MNYATSLATNKHILHTSTLYGANSLLCQNMYGAESEYQYNNSKHHYLSWTMHTCTMYNNRIECVELNVDVFSRPLLPYGYTCTIHCKAIHSQAPTAVDIPVAY